MASALGAWAQGIDAPGSGPVPDVRDASLRLGLEELDLPGSESLGLVGTTYLVEIAPGWWVGPAAYGAVTGERGGLFTVGGELAWRRALLGPLGLEIGLYAGGGGGGSAPVGGGLMLRPHLDLAWDFGRYRAGVSASRVRFPDGRIDSTQLGLVVSADTRFTRWPRTARRAAATSARAGIGVDRARAVAGVYRASGGISRADGDPLSRRIGFVGARVEQWLTPRVYWGLEANGAASGGVGGYAEYLGTLGVERRLGGAVSAGCRIALGMGGGGSVPTDGGLLGKLAMYATAHVSDDLGLTLEAGVARAPQGDFRAGFASLNLEWRLEDDAGSPARGERDVAVMEWVGGVARYDAARARGGDRRLSNVVLKFNRYVSDAVYLSGQVHSAYEGGAGGYSVGLVGAGATTRWWRNWRVGGELALGAAGGGGVDTRGGALAHPSMYLDRRLSPALDARVGVGRVRSFKGSLDATSIDVALVFGFGVPKRR
jgi:hypothetical protein